MAAIMDKYGRPHPRAPRELSQFAFLIGSWHCDITVRGEDGTAEAHSATLVARYILDGYAIAYEYRQAGPGGELVRFGATYRSYSAEKRAWIMKWYDALNATWLDLGPDDLGGVKVGRGRITFRHHLPADHLLGVTFSNISENRFTWTAEISTDAGRTWGGTVMVMEASRIET